MKLETAGGLERADGPDGSDSPDHPIGTDAVLVMQAIERAWSDDGVLVLMDLGSAVLSAEMAVDLLGDERRELIMLCEAPLVEGAVAAAVTAKLGKCPGCGRRGSAIRPLEQGRPPRCPAPHLFPRRRRSTSGHERRCCDRGRHRTRPARAPGGSLRADRRAIRRNDHRAQPHDRRGAGRCHEPQRRGDARSESGPRDRDQGVGS